MNNISLSPGEGPSSRFDRHDEPRNRMLPSRNQGTLTTHGLSPVPAAVGCSGEICVVNSTVAGTVGPIVPQVSLISACFLTDTAAGPLFSDTHDSPAALHASNRFGEEEMKVASPLPNQEGTDRGEEGCPYHPETQPLQHSSWLSAGETPFNSRTAIESHANNEPQAQLQPEHQQRNRTADRSTAPTRRGEGEYEVTSPLPIMGVDVWGEGSGTSHECLALTNSSLNPADQICVSHSSSASLSSTINENNRCFALQWNIRGLRGNLNELKHLVARHQPSVIALQETKADNRVLPPNFIGNSYTLLLATGSSRYWQQGVGLAIREGVPFERLEVVSNIQVIAVRVQLPQPVTVVSIYVPPNSQQSQLPLNELLEQLPEPVLLLGDFNAHHLAWGSNRCNTLGRYIAEKSLLNQLVILNDGSPTRIDPSTGTTSAIDISLCSETVAAKFIWHTLADTHNSDHYPIVISIPGWSQTVERRRKWLYDRADWAEFERVTAETIRPGDVIDADTFADRLVTAATASIPRSSGKAGPKAVPWWCPEVKAAIKRRRKALRALRRMATDNPRKDDALKHFREARAEAKKAIKDAKRRSWESFVSNISPSSSAAEMWRTVNILRGKRQQSTAVIRRTTGFTENVEEIVEELGRHYSERSATTSYPPLFQIDKDRAERSRFDPLPDTEELYNNDFTLGELLWALDRGRSASTGTDSVGYPMLRRLPLTVKTVLLELLNRIWRSGVFPFSWRTGTIIPIPKPNSNDAGPAAFRPITLVSCMSKVFERMVNRRLTTELESSGRLDKRQHAFRSGRGTDTYLAELERSLPNNDEHCLIASLDLAKAYDTTWRYGILRTLSKWQIRGRMFNMLNSFLSERSFRVYVGGHLSRLFPLENGVPQGSVLSVTLFLVAIQPVFRVIPNTTSIEVYADDILLVVKGRKEEPLYRKLQAAVKAVDKWAKSVGFNISATKSTIFYGSPNLRREPSGSICIDGVAIPKTNSLKILGVTIDRSLNFRAHCKQVKKSCESRLRIMKMIGARLPRGERSSLLQIGSAIITSRLLYGAGLVSRGGDTVVQVLAPAYNQMVRFASGAFVTSPIVSIMIEAGVLPFDLIFLQTIVSAAIRMLEKSSYNRDLPLIQRAAEILEEKVGIHIPTISVRSRLASRWWYEVKPHVVWEVKEQVKAGDPSTTVRPVVQQLLTERFSQFTAVYTDGSKDDNAVGAGVFCEGWQQAVGLPPQCSVFSAEAFALKAAISNPSPNAKLILSDSASCLSALEAGSSKHPWIQEIESLVRGRQISFCWIPGHAGIRGNVEADRLAGEGRSCVPLDISIPAADAIKEVKSAVRGQWQRRWLSLNDVKLREIKFDVGKWTDRSNLADQRALTRLRIGHTRLTHTFLLEKTEPPMCECCGETVTVRHIVLHCRKYDEVRSRCGIETTGLRAALKNNEDVEKKMIEYLKETQLYKKL